MKICIVGAPSSGKTALAKKLSKELELPVFDNEAQKLTKKTKIVFGIGTDYTADLILLGERIANAYSHWETPGIYTQTLLDSLAYQGIRKELYALQQYNPEHPESLVEMDREIHFQALIAEVFLRAFNYDKVYQIKMFEEEPKEPDHFINFIIEKAQQDVIDNLLKGIELEVISKQPPKIRRNKVEKDK